MSDALVQSATIQLKDQGGGVFGSVPPVANFTDGQPFTITGSGFGVKPTAAPIKFTKFNGYTDDTLLENNDADWIKYTGSGSTEGALIKSINPRYAGSKSAYNDMSRNGFNTNYHTFTPQNKVFLSYWYALNDAVFGDGGTDWVGKLCRINSSVAAGGGGVYNGLGNHIVSNQNPSGNLPPAINYRPNDVNIRTAFLNLPGNNDWVRIDMWVELSDLDVANGVFNVKSWGFEEENYTVTNRTTAGGAYQLDTVILGVMTANESGPTNAGMKVADPYIDNTRMRVELCDNADYSLASAPEVQPATAWADDSVTITANTGRYTSGFYYLHVLDESGNSVYSEQVTI